MDVFEAQSRARRRSGFLIALWIVLTAVLVVPAYAFVWFLAAGWPFATPLPGVDAPWWDPTIGIPTAIAVLASVFGGAAYHLRGLREGGHVVARLMGGHPLPDNPHLDEHRRLKNVADEMAIAAGLPTPRIFVMRAEPGINAFAAGLRPEDAAVTLTAGALERLDRAELQALVAHELAHIAQGDMRVRTLSLVLLHGFLFVSLAGAALMGGGLMRRGVRPGPPFFLGVALTAAGAMGASLARVLQAAVGRERELLTDARAAQYTRAPHALASALRKAGGSPDAAEVRHHYGKEVRHTFFAAEALLTAASPLATHPPLEARIRKLDPGWDGTYIYTEITKESTTAAIAEALEVGGQTAIPKNPEWNIAAHSGKGRSLRDPDRWVAGAFGNAARKISAERTSTPSQFEHRKRAPKVRLPSGPVSEGFQGPQSPLPSVPSAERIHAFLPVRTEAATLLTALAERAGGSSEEVQRALNEALSALPALGEAPPAPANSSPESTSDAEVKAALASLSKLSPGAIRRLLEACAFAVDRDGATTEEAAALLHTCSRHLGVDLPEPFQP